MSENSIGCAAVGGVTLIRYSGEPVLGVVELACGHFLDVGVQRSVRAKDALAQYLD
jgi:hypothetical protein